MYPNEVWQQGSTGSAASSQLSALTRSWAHCCCPAACFRISLQITDLGGEKSKFKTAGAASTESLSHFTLFEYQNTDSNMGNWEPSDNTHMEQ